MVRYLPEELNALCFPAKQIKAEADHRILKSIASEKFSEPNESRLINWIGSSLVILLIFFILLLTTMQKLRNTKKNFKKMEEHWLETFLSGQESLIDWNGDIVLQASYLPYRKEFEFPLENLSIGDELGSGEFGVVCRAIAKGLGKEGELEVAIKKSKKLNFAGMKAFADELKIMMFLQKVNKESHINIINLLGAITIDLKKGDICAILELCQHGNLKDFLRKNYMHFKNEIVREEHEENFQESCVTFTTCKNSSNITVTEGNHGGYM